MTEPRSDALVGFDVTFAAMAGRLGPRGAPAPCVPGSWGPDAARTDFAPEGGRVDPA